MYDQPYLWYKYELTDILQVIFALKRVSILPEPRTRSLHSQAIYRNSPLTEASTITSAGDQSMVNFLLPPLVGSTPLTYCCDRFRQRNIRREAQRSLNCAFTSIPTIPFFISLLTIPSRSTHKRPTSLRLYRSEATGTHFSVPCQQTGTQHLLHPRPVRNPTLYLHPKHSELHSGISLSTP